MRRLLIVCCASAFLDAMFFAALAPILPELRAEYSLSTAGAGLLSGSYAAGVLLIALPSGWFCARFGPRRTLILGLVGMGVFSTIFGFADAPWLLDSSRFMQGAGGALMWVGAMAWIINAGPAERRGALVGLLVAAATVGELLGAPTGALAHAVGMEIVFSVVGVVSAILMLIALGIPDAAPEKSQTFREARAAFSGWDLPAAMWLVAAAALAFGATTVIAPLHLDELGASAAAIAGGFAAGSLVETILGPQIGRLSDRIGRTRPYQLGILTGSVAVVLLAVLEQPALVIAALVATSFSAGLQFTPSLALVADVADGAGLDQGYASAATNIAWGGGQLTGSLGAGVLAGAGYLLPALVCVVVLASGAAVASRPIPVAAEQ